MFNRGFNIILDLIHNYLLMFLQQYWEHEIIFKIILLIKDFQLFMLLVILTQN